MDKNLGLGKGLSALMGEDFTHARQPQENNGITLIDIDLLRPSPFQPRRVFAESALMDLVASIREKGVLQPLLVAEPPVTCSSARPLSGLKTPSICLPVSLASSGSSSFASGWCVRTTRGSCLTALASRCSMSSVSRSHWPWASPHGLPSFWAASRVPVVVCCVTSSSMKCP